MTFLEILQDIGAIANDPDLTSSKERAKFHFAKTFSGLIMADEYTQNDIPGYQKLKTDLAFTTNPYNISTLNLLKIEKIFLDPTADNTSTMKFVSVKDIDDIAQMSSSAIMKPGKQDLFIYRIGNDLYGFTKDGSTTPASSGDRESTINLNQSSNDTFYMYYVEDFDYSGFTDDTEFQSSSDRLLSYAFTRKCIEAAGVGLIAEDAQ